MRGVEVMERIHMAIRTHIHLLFNTQLICFRHLFFPNCDYERNHFDCFNCVFSTVLSSYRFSFCQSYLNVDNIKGVLWDLPR